MKSFGLDTRNMCEGLPSAQIKFTLNYIFFFFSLALCVGRSAGGAYAGASAGYGVGASAAIGGGLDDNGGHGGSGAEAHANGISKRVVKLSQTEGGPTQTVSWTFFI